ncbi:MAG: histidine kinase [Burkholderiaceae bacterium]
MTVAILHALPPPFRIRLHADEFVAWLRSEPGAVAIPGLLTSAYSVATLAGSLSVAPELTPAIIVSGLMRNLAMVLVGWPAFLVTGYCFTRLRLQGWRVMLAALALGACEAGLVALTAFLPGWSDSLTGTDPGHAFAADTFAQQFSIVLVYYAFLRHRRSHDAAARRLAAAQQAQRETRRRLAEAGLKAMQARIDPQLLFDMLEAVRRAYETDPVRAEDLLDQLVAFLRAALPRLQQASSSVAREAEAVRACVRMHELAVAAGGAGLTLAIAPEAMDARFPPGVLLPLLNDALKLRPGVCALSAERVGERCHIVLDMPALPSQLTVARVAAVLSDLYGAAASLNMHTADGRARASMEVPYEPA